VDGLPQRRRGIGLVPLLPRLILQVLVQLQLAHQGGEQPLERAVAVHLLLGLRTQLLPARAQEVQHAAEDLGQRLDPVLAEHAVQEVADEAHVIEALLPQRLRGFGGVDEAVRRGQAQHPRQPRVGGVQLSCRFLQLVL
jgi:hypothetical protein